MVQADEKNETRERERAGVAGVAGRVALNVVRRQERAMEVEYDRICSYYGALRFAAAAGMTEILLTLPRHNPRREKLLDAYRNLADGLVKHQSSDGMWLQLVDDPAAWPETSGTGMFVFALATGVRERWLDPEPCGTAALRGWRALSNYVDSNGRTVETSRGVCPVNATAADYLGAQRLTDDFHGLAAALWAATSVLDFA